MEITPNTMIDVVRFFFCFDKMDVVHLENRNCPKDNG